MTSVRFKRVEKCRRLLKNTKVTLFGFEGAEALKLVLIVTRVHPFPFRTRKLSSFTPKILAWRRAGKIGNANTKETVERLSLFSSQNILFAKKQGLLRQSLFLSLNQSGWKVEKSLKIKGFLGGGSPRGQEMWKNFEKTEN